MHRRIKVLLCCWIANRAFKKIKKLGTDEKNMKDNGRALCIPKTINIGRSPKNYKRRERCFVDDLNPPDSASAATEGSFRDSITGSPATTSPTSPVSLRQSPIILSQYRPPVAPMYAGASNDAQVSSSTEQLRSMGPNTYQNFDTPLSERDVPVQSDDEAPTDALADNVDHDSDFDPRAPSASNKKRKNNAIAGWSNKLPKIRGGQGRTTAMGSAPRDVYAGPASPNRRSLTLHATGSHRRNKKNTVNRV